MADASTSITSMARLTVRAAKFNRFALIFAICDSLEEQEHNVIELSTICNTHGVTIAELNLFQKEPVTNLKTEIQHYLQEHFPDSSDTPLGLQVTGIDLSIVLDSDEKAPAIVQTLNMAREGFRESLPYPIIIWLPEYAYAKIATIAPDFWSVRDGSYTFSTNDQSAYILNKIESGDKNLTQWQDKIAQIPVLRRALTTLRDNAEVITELYIKLGEAYYFIENSKEAQNAFEKALAMIGTDDYPDKLENKARAFSKLSLIYSDNGDVAKAIETINHYIDIAKRLNKPDLQAIAYNHLGLIHDRQQQHQEAIKAYEQALEINQAEGNRKSEGEVLGNMGLLYRKWNQQYEIALKYHEQALDISTELSDNQGQALEYGNIGLVYHQMKSFDMAIDYYGRALEAHKRTGNRNAEINEFIHLGDVYRDQGNETEAKENYQKAINLSKEIGASVLRIYDRLAEMYGPKHFNHTDESIRYLELLIQLCEDQNNTEKQLHYWENCCSIYQENEVQLRECWMKMKPLLEDQLGEGKNQLHSLEALIHICRQLGAVKDVDAYEKRLDEISKRLTIWIRKSANVTVENNIPVIKKGWACHLDVSFSEDVKDYLWKYDIPIPIERETHINIESDDYLEGRRISESSVSEEEEFTENNQNIELKRNNSLPNESITEQPEQKDENPKKRKSIWKWFASFKRKKTKTNQQKPFQSENVPQKSGKIENDNFFSKQKEEGKILLAFHTNNDIAFSKPDIAIDIGYQDKKEVPGTVIIPRKTGNYELTLNCTIESLAYRKPIKLPVSIIAYQDAPEISSDDPLTSEIWIEPITQMRFVWIPGGYFLMGSPDDEPERFEREGPLHEVCVDGFWMGQFPVIQQEWETIMGNNPSYFKSGPNFPVENVSWDDVQSFIEKVNQQSNDRFRLPTEAEWEYACRAVTQTPFYFGGNLDTDQANYDGNFPYANGKKGEYRKKTTTVGLFPPNNFGLYDMHGNVLEWCEDYYDEKYYRNSPKKNPINLSESDARVVRGGSWDNPAGDCRVAYRDGGTPDDRDGIFGFRLCLSPRSAG
jgi:formylglycine-generating enzyme required for sulfatase activity/tetratricopeptide (TPR) repeat protein